MAISPYPASGFIPFRGYKVWYKIVGNEGPGNQLPLLCLHGGPGAAHDYLEPIEALAQTGRRVIFYDQLGNGNSDHPHDPSMWSLGLFLEELHTVCPALKLDRFHLLGQSWGGMLAMEFALTKPSPGPASLILANSLSNTSQWIDEANRLCSELPSYVRQILEKQDRSGNAGNAAHEQAMMFFYRRHLCRTDPWPECLFRTFRKMAENPEVYKVMWGSSEFHVTGKLRNWDIRERLHEIQLPTLLLSGRYDEATPAITETLHNGIPGSKWVLFEHSSHMPHIEETERFLQVIEAFMRTTESATT